MLIRGQLASNTNENEEGGRFKLIRNYHFTVLSIPNIPNVDS